MKPIFLLIGIGLLIAGLYVAGAGLPLSVTGSELNIYVQNDGVPCENARGTATSYKTGTSINLPKSDSRGRILVTGLDIDVSYKISISWSSTGTSTTDQLEKVILIQPYTSILFDFAHPEDDGAGYTAPVGTLGGKVTSDGGKVLGGAIVKVTGPQNKEIPTDSNGVYLINLAPGTYKVYATYEGSQSALKDVVIHGMALTTANLDLNVRGLTLALKVVSDYSGDPIEDAEVTIQGITQKTQDTGYAYFIAADDLIEGIWPISIEKGETIQYASTITLGPMENILTVVVEERGVITTYAGTLKVTVTMEGTGEAIENAQVQVFIQGTTEEFCSAVTSTEGKVAVDLNPGDYVVVVSAMGFETQTEEYVLITSKSLTSVNIALQSDFVEDSNNADIMEDYYEESSGASMTFTDIFIGAALAILGLIFLAVGLRGR